MVSTWLIDIYELEHHSQLSSAHVKGWWILRLLRGSQSSSLVYTIDKIACTFLYRWCCIMVDCFIRTYALTSPWFRSARGFWDWMGSTDLECWTSTHKRYTCPLRNKITISDTTLHLQLLTVWLHHGFRSARGLWDWMGSTDLERFQSEPWLSLGWVLQSIDSWFLWFHFNELLLQR